MLNLNTIFDENEYMPTFSNADLVSLSAYDALLHILNGNYSGRRQPYLKKMIEKVEDNI